jgi:hypothetical protein
MIPHIDSRLGGVPYFMLFELSACTEQISLVSLTGTIVVNPMSALLSTTPLLPYDGDTIGQPSTCVQRVESDHDEFVTVASKVTVVTTVTKSTITTHKRYRIEDA